MKREGVRGSCTVQRMVCIHIKPHFSVWVGFSVLVVGNTVTFSNQFSWHAGWWEREEKVSQNSCRALCASYQEAGYVAVLGNLEHLYISCLGRKGIYETMNYSASGSTACFLS